MRIQSDRGGAKNSIGRVCGSWGAVTQWAANFVTTIHIGPVEGSVDPSDDNGWVFTKLMAIILHM